MHTGTLKVLLIVATFTAAALAGPIAAGLERTLGHAEATEPALRDICDSERRSDRSAAADGVLLL
ncbi:MAG: hypothetical protein PVG76_03305 [Chromatiales bacterium]|jgi:hypothetical protein